MFCKHPVQGSNPCFGSHFKQTVMEAILNTDWGDYKVGDRVQLNEVQMAFALKHGLAKKAERTTRDKAERAPKNKGNDRV